MKSDEEILNEAREAYENDAYRYCMVFSGRDIGSGRTDRIINVVKEIKKRYSIEVCVSAGFLTKEEAIKLKDAGVNRYNHNINTSMENYGNICSSHDFKKRLETINNAKDAGLDLCCGVIIGLGETIDDLVSIISELKKVGAKSVPVNFFIPVEGHGIKNPQKLTPEYCLKILSIFRFGLPDVELRAAGGREYHLRSMQALCLYIVDSVFSKGYLTVGGECINETKQMIIDNGFEIDRIEY
jgi:biotin synthase